MPHCCFDKTWVNPVTWLITNVNIIEGCRHLKVFIVRAAFLQLSLHLSLCLSNHKALKCSYLPVPFIQMLAFMEVSTAMTLLVWLILTGLWLCQTSPMIAFVRHPFKGSQTGSGSREESKKSYDESKLERADAHPLRMPLRRWAYGRETTCETLARPNTWKVMGPDIFDIRPDRERWTASCLERLCEYSQARTHEGENQEKKQKKSMMIVIDDEVLTEDLAS